ncbi:MAG: helix-turn-helix domain-containing protein [Solirubrobacteraceae bacterium]
MTTLQFRNLTFDPAAPIDRWPAEAIETVIDRGSLSDWRRLAEAIRRDPWGPAARSTETVVAWGEHYGVDALMSGVIGRAREQITLVGRAEYAAQIRSWRAHSGMTLRQFARAAGTSASRLSDYEHAKVAPTTDVLARLKRVHRRNTTETQDAKAPRVAAKQARHHLGYADVCPTSPG